MLEHRKESHLDERMRHAAVSVFQPGRSLRVPAGGGMSHRGSMLRRMSGRELPRTKGNCGTLCGQRLRYTARFWRQVTTELSGSDVSGIRFTLIERTEPHTRQRVPQRRFQNRPPNSFLGTPYRIREVESRVADSPRRYQPCRIIQ